MRGQRIAAVFVIAIAASTAFADPNTDLIAAAKKGDAAKVKKLIGDGADVNFKTPYGVTALLQAAGQGHLEVVKILLEHKADPNVKDTFYGQTPLDSAGEEGKIEILKALLDAGAKGGKDVLRTAAAGGKLELVKVILEKAKLEPDDLTAALASTPAKHKEVVELLTKAGAKPAKKAEPVAGANVDRKILETYVGKYQEKENLIDLTIDLKEDKLTGKFEGGN